MTGVGRYLRVGIGLAFAGAALLLIDWRGVLFIFEDAVAKAISPQALAVAIVGQTAALSVCAAGLWVLSPQIGWPASFLSRWVRDGVGALPIGLPGLGEAAGVRALGLFGVLTTVGVAISTTDILAETMTQAIYALSAVLLGPSSLRISLPKVDPPLVELTVAGLAIAAASVWGARLAPPAWRASVASVLVLVGRSLRSRAFVASFGLHLLAWIIGGMQIFLLARSLGAPLSIMQAMSLEGLVFAVRSAFFFVPAGAGVQEVGLAAVGAAYGLAPVDIAALALLLRLRDLLVLTPALAVWLILEARRAVAPLSPAPSPRPGSV